MFSLISLFSKRRGKVKTEDKRAKERVPCWSINIYKGLYEKWVYSNMYMYTKF